LYGKPWFEKPPLFYWGAAVCFKLFGVSEAAARLPSAISALLATLALAWLAFRLYGAETARWLLLLLPTTVGMIGFSHAAATDMPFSGMLTIAMVCAAVVLRLQTTAGSGANPALTNLATSWAALILFGVFLGLAVLAKGPAAIIVCGGAVFFWALFTKRWRDAFRLFHPAAIAAFCLTALPWYILCARRNPDFFRVFIIEHNFKRFLTPEFQHIQPFWFYVPVLLVAFVPWIVVLVWSSLAGAIALWRRQFGTTATLFFVCWAGFCVLFFTVSRSKLPGYVLPAVPAIGILLAADLSRRSREHLWTLRSLCFFVGLTFVVLGVAANRFGGKLPFVTDIYPAPTVTHFVFFCVLGGSVVVLFGFLRRERAALLLAAVVFPVFMILGTESLEALDAGVSARSAAIGAENHFTAAELNSASTYELSRGFKFGLNFYLHRELQEWGPPAGRSSVIFTSYKGSRELQKMGIRCFSYNVHPGVEICSDPSGVANSPLGATGSGKPQ
jgi:4-amino-4-deoxy-L-arabinose transferase-like glycosyltransferase